MKGWKCPIDGAALGRLRRRRRAGRWMVAARCGRGHWVVVSKRGVGVYAAR
jgi:hypothetical protein